jgi:fructokinase
MIVVAGDALVDRIVRLDGTVIEVPGGGQFNTARAIARLGVPVAFLGSLSSDAWGVRLRRTLEQDGVDLSLAATVDAPTTLAVAEIDANGTAAYRFETAGTSASMLDAEAVRAAVALAPAALHVGTLGLALEPIATALTGFVAAVGRDTLVMLDPNCRLPAVTDRATYLDRLRAVLARADVVKASHEDLAYLRPGDTPLAAAQGILRAGPRAVIVTAGAGPVACLTEAGIFELPVPAIQIVDSVGAGDAFGGAFLARWVDRGLDRARLADRAALRDAVATAIAAAAVTCGRSGADPPRRDELEWSAA